MNIPPSGGHVVPFLNLAAADATPDRLVRYIKPAFHGIPAQQVNFEFMPVVL